MKTVLIAGDRSGCGKTSISLALSSLLSREMRVQTFKAGMDYIDPSYLSGVTGRPCRNLDSYVMSEEEIWQVFAHGCRGADFALVEGVRGLFEGSEALGDTGSTESIARVLDIPVVLVISARSITRSAAAIVKGFQAFSPSVKIRGVILNNVMGPRHAEKAVTAIEHYCNVPVIGAIPRMEEMELTMRHLGLVPFLEKCGNEEFHRRIDVVTRMIQEHVSTDHLKEIAADIDVPGSSPLFSPAVPQDVEIAVALDEAFNFYYSDLADILGALGAKVVNFSPIHDTLPSADGYIIGGGYPELFLDELEKNEAMREGIFEVSRNGVPMYAECGGLMYLTENIRLKPGWQGIPDERIYDMAGVFPGETRMPARRIVSYVEGESLPGSPMGQARFRGHEFHYSDVRLAEGTHYAYRLNRGTGIEGMNDAAVTGNTQGSYTHLHPVPSKDMFRHFTRLCRTRS